MKMSQFILSNMPNGRHPLSWLLFVLLLIIMIPILILMVILIPLLLIFNLVKMRFFPNKNPKTFITPFGFAAYSQINRTVVNYPWHDIAKVEVWTEDGKTFPVLHMQNGEPVKLIDVPVEQVKVLCDQHGITFYQDVVVVQDA